MHSTPQYSANGYVKVPFAFNVNATPGTYLFTWQFHLYFTADKFALTGRGLVYNMGRRSPADEIDFQLRQYYVLPTQPH